MRTYARLPPGQGFWRRPRPKTERAADPKSVLVACFITTPFQDEPELLRKGTSPLKAKPESDDIRIRVEAASRLAGTWEESPAAAPA